jgi:predicted porin
MNKNIKLAVAGAVLALSASANAGIIIPAGDWTLDISGNVNSFYTYTNAREVDSRNGQGIAGGTASFTDNDNRKSSTISTGLLPNYLSVSGSTRQNDLDVAFTISINPGSATPNALIQQPRQENRQAFVTFGDKSWGSFKVGKDLGVFGSDAILNDMTLLGVGGNPTASNRSNTTTIGGIGTGYVYADWMAQIAYTTPNWSGVQATVAMVQSWDPLDTGNYWNATSMNKLSHKSPGFEAKASYSFAANDVTGKVWVGGLTQKHNNVAFDSQYGSGTGSVTSYAGEIGGNINASGFGLTGYYYAGQGLGTTGKFLNAFGVGANNDRLEERDSDGGYIQATYIMPTKTKLGAAYGVSNLDRSATERGTSNLVRSNERVTLGAYHPLTKHLNLVAEYSKVESQAQNNSGNSYPDQKAHSFSAGAILFF